MSTTDLGTRGDLAADVRDIYLGNLGTVEADLDLPATGRRGSAFTWRSGEPLFLSDEGVVNRPSLGVGNRIVPLHLTATLDGIAVEHSYDVTVLEEEVRHTVTSVPPLEIPLLRGTDPDLPAFVPVLLDDGVGAGHAVRWDQPVTHEDGSRTATGTVEGTDLPARLRLVPVDELPGTERTHRWAAHRQTVEQPVVRVDPDSRFGRAQAWVLDHLRTVDPDQLLYSFRQTVGLDTRGADPMTGWDSPQSKLRGHTTGHYLSALALAVRASGDDDVRATLITLVAGLAECQRDGYVGAYDPEQFDLLEVGTPYPAIWAPYYTLDKVLSGLLDAAELAGVEQALAVATGLGGWVRDRLARLTKAQRDAMWSTYIAGEFGGLMSALVRLADRTGDRSLLTTAGYFINDKLVVPLTAGVDPLGGMHANQHIPQAIGALDLGLATGDPVLTGVGEAFWQQVTSHHLYAIGGTGETEMFRAPDQIAGYLTDKCAETCATHNMLRLTAGLFRAEPRAALMDFYERALVNHLATTFSKRPDGGSTYFLPLHPGARKSFDTAENTCCHGTGLENAFRFVDQAVTLRPGEAWINLALPVRAGDCLTVRTPAPERMVVELLSGGELAVHLRVPSWSDGATVLVNGVTASAHASDGYLTLRDTWAAGDTIELCLAPRVTLEPCPDDPTLVAVVAGPYVLAARTDTSEVPVVDLAALRARAGAQPVGSPVEVDGLSFVPIADIGDESYQVYLRDHAHLGVPTMLPW